MRALLLGDVLSSVGRGALRRGLASTREKYRADLCVANVENSAGMFGITRKVKDEISRAGVDIMTSGNHIWDNSQGVELLDTDQDILRPANYPPDVPGRGYLVKEFNGVPVAVVNLQGRTFMPPTDCPFRKADQILEELKGQARIIIVDFHAEATSEKLALGFYLDGRASVVAGTHTHVPTADERILEGGTAYQTDIGMAGPLDSVIGMKKKNVIRKFLTGTRHRFNAGGADPVIQGLLAEIDEDSGRATDLLRVFERIEED
ncbi:MAG: TIGR00282 family metallophosphoesterase [Candidatus Latescibacteria bacterium]|nr:TIGR00282 family metallophosphoesterase [bacterium]MBD3423697.1 TIGR00282 family metallophosphoesterase [Candidatus Latescibacterota bacterium]